MQESCSAPSADGAQSTSWEFIPPELQQRIASFLPSRNYVSCTLRLINKQTKAAFPNAVRIRLSRPVPHHAFLSRWCQPDVLRTLPLKTRRQLLCLTAASGDVQNLDAALFALGCLPTFTDVAAAAAAAGALPALRLLASRGCCLEGSSSSRSGYGGRSYVLAAAAAAGRRDVCAWLLEEAGVGWSRDVVLAAVQAGHTATAAWLKAWPNSHQAGCSNANNSGSSSRSSGRTGGGSSPSPAAGAGAGAGGSAGAATATAGAATAAAAAATAYAAAVAALYHEDPCGPSYGPGVRSWDPETPAVRAITLLRAAAEGGSAKELRAAYASLWAVAGFAPPPPLPVVMGAGGLLNGAGALGLDGAAADTEEEEAAWAAEAEAEWQLQQELGLGLGPQGEEEYEYEMVMARRVSGRQGMGGGGEGLRGRGFMGAAGGQRRGAEAGRARMGA